MIQSFGCVAASAQILFVLPSDAWANSTTYIPLSSPRNNVEAQVAESQSVEKISKV
jgi:hypothetical protein